MPGTYRVTYLGPSDAVTAPTLGATFRRGVPVEVDAADAALLADQADVWTIEDGAADAGEDD